MNKKPNVLLLTVDCLRADHLGCYGYHHATSPYIDALAAEGVLGERFLCPVIPTHPSYTTLYTGQHPITHGIVAHSGRTELDRDAPFLPEIFLQAGYTTCAVDNLWRGRPWFGRGYEYYIDPSVRRPLLLGVTCDELNARTIPWLRAHAREPFFLFMHYWDPHWPLNPPERFNHLFYEGNPTDPDNHSLDPWWQHPLGALARDTWLRMPGGAVTDAEYVRAMYDREIRSLDDGVRNLVTALDDLGLAENTLVVLIADHGESMTEHDIYFSHIGLYEPTIHIPLILRWPGHLPEGVRLGQMFEMDDLTPTILEAVGLPVPQAMDGRSFWPLLQSPSPADAGGGRDRLYSLECTWQAKWCLRTDRLKFILAREPDFYGAPPRELYDLVDDPGEVHNLVDERPDVAAAMEAELEGWISDRLQALGKSQDPVREHRPSLSHGLPVL